MNTYIMSILAILKDEPKGGYGGVTPLHSVILDFQSANFRITINYK